MMAHDGRLYARKRIPPGALTLLLAALVFALGMMSVHDPATWIHIKTGLRILATKAVPRREPFSYGAAGAPWSTDSWLSDVIFAKADAWGGAGLLFALKSAILAAAFAAALAINAGDAVVAAAVLALGAGAAWAGFTELPSAWDFLGFACLLRLLRPSGRFRLSRGVGAVAIVALWANLHGASAPLALGLVGLKTLEASMRTTAWERLGYWATLAASAIVFSWNPHGYGVFADAFVDAGPAATAWSPALASAAGLFLAGGAGACWFTLQEEFVVTLAAAAVIALGLALPGLRPLAVFAACPAIALALAHARAPRGLSTARVLAWTALAAAVLAANARWVRPQSESGYGTPTLEGAVRFLDREHVRGRMFNEPAIGAELIGLTDRSVFVDERQDLYSEAFRRDAADWPHLFHALDSVYHFDYVVLRDHRAAAPALEEDPAWRLAYVDDHARVYIKKQK